MIVLNDSLCPSHRFSLDQLIYSQNSLFTAVKNVFESSEEWWCHIIIDQG